MVTFFNFLSELVSFVAWTGLILSAGFVLFFLYQFVRASQGEKAAYSIDGAGKKIAIWLFYFVLAWFVLFFNGALQNLVTPTHEKQQEQDWSIDDL